MIRKIIEDVKIKKTQVSNKPSYLTELKNSQTKVIEIKPTQVFEKKIEEAKKENIETQPTSTKRISRDPHLHHSKRQISKVTFILFLVALIVGIIFWGSFIFENVNINITKKNQIFNLNKETFTASRASESNIPFEIMIVSDEQSEKITFSEGAEVSLKAKGEVVIYNEYSKTAEKILAHTYLSDEKGKVYQTDKAVSVPGYTLKDNKIIPGQVKVSATSFLPGEAYNGEPQDFTINNYKGTPKFKKIYGKAGSVFGGGASGLNYSLSDSDKENLKNIANTSLKNNLSKKINSLIPKEFIYYTEASSFSYVIPDNILSPTKEAEVEISATLSAVLLNEKKLKESVITALLLKEENQDIKNIQVVGLDKLVFNFTNKDQIVSKEIGTISFGLAGDIELIWIPNQNQIKSNLLGASKEKLVDVFKQDVGVGNAEVKIFPPWLKILPTDPNKIKIKVF